MGTKVLLLILAALLIIANPVMAGNRDGAVTLSPFFGGQIFVMGSEHLDTDFSMGFRGGYNFTRHVGAELMFAYIETVHDPEEIHANVYRYGADILYHFRPDQNLVPFVAAGFGGFTVDYATGLNDQTSPYFNYGAGLEYSLADWVALRGDLRHTIVFDGGFSVLEATVGLKFQFGCR